MPRGVMIGPQKVATFDLWCLILSQVRYAMGRETAIVSHTREVVTKYANGLTSAQLAQIQREVLDELRRVEKDGKWLGHSTDHTEWATLARVDIPKILKKRGQLNTEEKS